MKYEIVVRIDPIPQIDPSRGAWYRSGMAPIPSYRPRMFRLVYRERFCRDCHERNQWPICECGYMRPLSDEFSVIEYAVRYRWTPAGAVPSLPFTRFDLAQIRDAIIAHGHLPDDDGSDAASMHGADVARESFAHLADDAAGEDDLLEIVIDVLTVQ